VHPAGMAVDLRIPTNPTCRRWLENTLVQLDRQGVVSAIRESRPPHYHVAVFPTPYLHYVARLTGGTPTRVASAPAPAPAARASVEVAAADILRDAGEAGEPGESRVDAYRVNRGDSLWSIARRHGTTVETLRELNNLNGTRIVAGQVLSVPSP
jgi:nucleoid-associated protein YgaU